MAEDPIRKELDALKADITQLRHDIAGLTGAIREVSSEKVADAKAQAQQRARGTWENVERKLDDLLEKGRETVDNAEHQIGEHPVGSILTAFGLGFIIAKLLDMGGPR